MVSPVSTVHVRFGKENTFCWVPLSATNNVVNQSGCHEAICSSLFLSTIALMDLPEIA